MKRLFFLVFILSSLTSFGQFLNYTNINGRYKWIAGKFDSTFTIPSGTTPSLRTSGGNAPGALFYSTTDSTVYQYTGTQWTRLRGTDTAHVISAYVRNTTASPMTPGQVVYINGSTGTTPTIALANNKQDSTSAMTFGFVRGNIPVNGFGYITTFGPLEGVNTNAYTEGEVIYLDSIPGQFTHNKPQAPYHMVTLGYIIKKSGGNGTIYAKIQNGYELDELHNVRITEPVLNKSVIIYDSVKGYWVDTTVSAAGLGLGGSGTTNYISKWTGSTALGNSQIFDNGTNVGINTATPNASYNLTINDNSGSDLLFQYQGNSALLLGSYAAGSGSFIAESRAVNLTFQVGGTDVMRFFSNTGNVGIGTGTNAGYRLDVSGTFRSTLDANINGLTVGKGGGSVSTNTALGVSALAVNTTGVRNTVIGSNAGAANITSSDLTFVGANAGQSATGQSNTAIGADAANRLTSGASNLFVGRSSGYATTTGSANVYVGMQAGYDVTTASGNTIVGYNTGRGITTGQYNTIIGSEVGGLSSSLSNTIILADGQGNQRLYINNSGNVGLGTTSPQARLSLGNTSGITLYTLYDNVNTYYQGIGNNITSGTNVMNLMLYSNTTGTGRWAFAHVYTANNTTTERFTFLIGATTSFLGIGNANPAGKLDFGSSGGTFFAHKNTATNKSAKIVGSETGIGIYTGGESSTTNGVIDFGGQRDDNGTTSSRMQLVVNTGNLLIGTTTDAGYKLDVNGTARVSGSMQVAANGVTNLDVFGGSGGGASQAIRIYGTTPSTQGLLLSYDTGSAVSFIDAGYHTTASGNAFGDIVFRSKKNATNTLAENMRIRGFDGNVLIGTSTNDASAIVNISSTTKGFLPPRMTGAQAEAIATPAAGLLVYANNGNGTTITSTGWWGYDGTNWVKLN